MENSVKYIHLLYVPTMACNMGCKYCYLEDNTKEEKTPHTSLETLQYAISKMKEKNVIPFNISLHGGEVTTLSKKEFEDIIRFIDTYYEENRELIQQGGFKIGRPHIKTNLYQLEKHIDTIKKYNVSISGSLDLPLSLHNQYRVTKGNEKTLDKILKNIELLREIPNKKKVSATIFKEHFQYLDEIVEDIRYLHKNTCLDMNDFNFMIGFDYNSCGLLHHMTEEEQLLLYQRMHQEFDGTDLDAGVNGPWFDEFGPGYCTNCDNCGEKFFLLEKNGDIYSCVRGQKNPDYYYGNIYQNSIEEILATAQKKIFLNHNREDFSKACENCPYLYLCKTGCPFVKNIYHTNKSYTCKLQQQMYQDRGYQKDPYAQEFLYQYVSKMRKEDSEKYLPKKETEDSNTLEKLIAADSKLKYIYDENVFLLKVDEMEYSLSSQILKSSQDFVYLTKESKITIYMKKNMIEEECDYPENNALYIILLSGDLVTYGDEQREKQRHLATEQVYKGVLDRIPSSKKGYYAYDLGSFLATYQPFLSVENANNLFFTTTALRDYHYLKQKNNAYYHMQAINLPFQNIEFYYIDKELKS